MTRKWIALAALLAFGSPALASQGSGCMPTTGTVSGLALVTDINAANAAFISANSGSSAPATDCSGIAIKGQIWLDTSTTPNVMKFYDGTSWMPIGSFNSSHIWAPPIGGGTNSLTAASTTELGSVAEGYVTISGNTTITAFGSTAATGVIRFLNFTGTPQITYNATSMILPSAANIQVVAGDQAIAAHLGSGNWRIVSYTPISGQAVVNPSLAVGTGAFSFATTAPSGFAFAYGQDVSRATFAALLTATTVAGNGTRVSGSAIITSLADTSQMRTGHKVEGTGIPAGTSILTVDSATQITLSANASSSGTSTVTVFMYGNGDGSTTFTLPDCRGVVIAGRGNMGGSDRALLTSTYFGASGTGLGAFGGAQSQTLTLAQSAAHTHTGTTATESAAHSHDPLAGGSFVYSQNSGTAPTGPGQPVVNSNITTGMSNETAPHVHGFTTASAGGGAAHPIVQPTLIANCLIKTTN